MTSQNALNNDFGADNQFATLKPSRSVDFATIAVRRRSASSHGLNSAAQVASQFSRRASLELKNKSSHSMPMTKDTICMPKLCLSAQKMDYGQYTSQCLEGQAAASERVRLPARSTWVESDQEIHADSWGTLLRKIVPMRTLTLGILLVATFSSSSSSKTHSLMQKSPASASPRSSISLGSAAISSVTEALSPILPFTGGLDLRREDYWVSSGNWWELLQGVAVQVQDAFTPQDDVVDEAAAASLSSPDAPKSRVDKQKAKRKNGSRNYISAISGNTPFISLDFIADLTLGEVAETFHWASDSSRKNFNFGKFLSKASPRVRPVLEAMQQAVARSRGKHALDSLILPSTAATDSFGQIDVLKFCAAMRIFAEWRVLRQVPEGYKGYAVGMSLGHKDIVQNLAKIEQAVHGWLEHRQDSLSLAAQYDLNSSDRSCSLDAPDARSELRSPTLRELLQHEIELDVHPTARLPRLKEKSAAMGLLWVRRQLDYQLRLVGNILEVPIKYSSTRDAVSAAYKQVYDPYHGWPVQKIFNYSFQAAPDAALIFRHMNPHRLKEVKDLVNRKARSNNSSGAFPLKNESAVTEQSEPDNPWEHVVRFVGNLFSPKPSREDVGDSQGGGSNSGDSKRAVEAFVAEEMLRDAHAQITEFLKIVNPLLKDVEVLFHKLNMDDPTRV